MEKDYDIVGSFNNQLVPNIDAERSVNLYEFIYPNGKKPKVLQPTSGLKNSGVTFTGAANGFRAQFVFNNNMYVVIGNAVYLINSSLAVSLLGTLTTTTGYVGVDANTFQVIFVDGTHGYIWDTTALTWSQITDTSFPAKPIDVCNLDNFFVVANGTTNTFQLSSLNQGMVWGAGSTTFTADSTTDLLTVSSANNYATGIPVKVSNSGGALPSPLNDTTTYYCIKISSTTLKLATSYANAIAGIAIDLTDNGTGTQTITVSGQVQLGAITSHPGTIVACRTLHRRLFLFSQNYTEVWENAGLGTNLPFRRNNTLLMEFGCAAIGSIVAGFDKMFFLSQDEGGLGPVMEVVGTQAIPVSNKAIDSQLQQYVKTPTLGVSDAVGILIRENGVIFYRLNFSNANHTYVYNVTMSDAQNLRWHEEEVLNGNRHPAQTQGYFNGINYYGHYSQPILYIVDSSYPTNDGETIRRMRIGRPEVIPTYNRRRIDRFWLDVVQGQVENQLNNNAPEIFLSYSKDGGQTYGSRVKASMGQIGKRSARTVWRKLGVVPRGQAFVPKIEFFDQIAFVILGAAWNYEDLPE